MSETTTVYVSIGNSDDRLSQRDWSEFTDSVDMLLRSSGKLHGAWFSLPNSRWQNACWCIELSDDRSVDLTRASLESSRVRYRQDSVKWDVVQPGFITASPHATEAPCFAKGHEHR